MALITWDSSYSVNVLEIDQQHQRLVELINALHDSVGGSNSLNSGKIYNELINYTIVHFTHEENLLRKAKYADYNDHKEVHESIIERIKKLQKSYFEGNANAIPETLEFMKNWLFKHIAGTDKKYTATLNAAGIK